MYVLVMIRVQLHCDTRCNLHNCNSQRIGFRHFDDVKFRMAGVIMDVPAAVFSLLKTTDYLTTNYLAQTSSGELE
jgi:hypothetical protein